MAVLIMLMFLFSFLAERSNCYASQIKSHTLDLTQHLLLPKCINSSTTTAAAAGISNSKDSTTLQVVHRQSLCHEQTRLATLSSSSIAEEILRKDQLRVKSIQAKINTNEDHRSATLLAHSTDLPVHSGLYFDDGDYIVSISLGTPTKKLHLIFDTGSDITWTQCQPCLKHCYKQRDRIFNPANSTSYINIPCKAAECQPKSYFDCYHGVTCVYTIEYGDQSYTIGFLAKDKLTVTPNDVFPNFVFGCGQNNTGLFGKTAGLLGLSRGKLSFVSQTKNIYLQYFSYRLPPNIHSTGHLMFGKNSMNSKDVKFTPLIEVPNHPYFYFIHIISITVGDIRLPIEPSVFKRDNTVIDSGTVITRLPKDAYNAMSTEFKRQMNTKLYPIAPGVSLLDTCFNVSKCKYISFPSISFTFEGKVTVDLDPSGILYVIDSSLACLAFAGNTDPDDFTIFGNKQQLNLEVVYDVAGGKLGFGR